MKTALIFATSNPNKSKEVAQIIGSDLFEIKNLADIHYTQEIVEDGDTLEANAIIKAQTIYQLNYPNVFAEDTGLEVVALDMAPGVYTARYAGPQKNAQDNMDKLILALEDKEDRSARFRTVVALILDGQQYTFEGEVWGKIALERMGDGGFGYDPIFIPDGYDMSFGQLSNEVKNSISHRYRAINKMADFLKTI